MYYQKQAIHRRTRSRPVIMDVICFQSIMNATEGRKSKWLPAVRTIIVDEERGRGRI